jgi:hypothetical protein
MHPTKKAVRIAGAIYLTMVFTAPFIHDSYSTSPP